MVQAVELGVGGIQAGLHETELGRVVVFQERDVTAMSFFDVGQLFVVDVLGMVGDEVSYGFVERELREQCAGDRAECHQQQRNLAVGNQFSLLVLVLKLYRCISSRTVYQKPTRMPERHEQSQNANNSKPLSSMVDLV